MIDTNELRSMVNGAQFEGFANSVIHSLLDRLEAVEKEIDALRAKIEQMEKQEPVGVLHVGSCYGEELEDWEFEANQCACDKLNEAYVHNPTSLQLYALPGAQASSDLAEAIIADMQAQYDSELITENDSGDALIRLDGAIAAVEDNFAQAQPAPSVPDDVMRDAERYRYLRGRDDSTAGVGCWLEAGGKACARGWLNGDQLDRAIDCAIEALAAAPEAKP